MRSKRKVETSWRRREMNICSLRRSDAYYFLWFVLAFSSLLAPIRALSFDIDSSMDRDWNTIRLLRPKRPPEKGEPSHGESSSDDQDRPSDHHHHPTPAPGAMEKPSLERPSSSSDEYPSSFTIDLSAALVVSMTGDVAGAPLWNRGNTTNIDELTEMYRKTVDGIVKALEFIITHDVGYDVYAESDQDGTSEDETMGAQLFTPNDAGQQRQRYMVAQKSAWVESTREDTIIGEEDSSVTEALVTWVDTRVEYTLTVDNTTDALPQVDVDNVFDRRHQNGPHNHEEDGHKRSDRLFAAKLRRVRDDIRDKTVIRIRDGVLLHWIGKEEDRAVGVAMVYDGHDATFVDFGDNFPPNPGNGTDPVGNPGPLDFPFNDPLNVNSWDPLQTVGLVVFGLTTLGTTVLCLISGRRSSFRGKRLNSSATLGCESGINELLDRSNRFMPPQYRYRRDSCAPILVQMPAQQWEDPSVLYPHDRLMREELRGFV